jgi:hypothetical protein
VKKNEQFFWDYNNYFEADKFIRPYDSLDWIVIGSTQFSSFYIDSERKNEGSYRLVEGDFIKLGKIIFLVRKIKVNEDDIKKANESFTSNSVNNNNANMNLYSNSINEELIIYKYKKKNTNFSDIFDSMKTISAQKTKDKEDKDIKNEDENSKNENSINNKLKHLYVKLKNVNDKNLKPFKCRICFSEGNFEDKNPLISPCNCTGSVKYIHLNCLRKWLTSKINIKSSSSGNIYCYSFKDLECEICKSTIPEQVEYRGKIISLLDFKDIEPPYILLQTMNQYCPYSKSLEYNVIFVMSLKKKNFLVLGRANTCDIKLNDISVSRNHSIISYDKGKFYIDDIGSKFGTLLLIQNNLLFLPYKEISIQTGPCHLIFYVVRTILGCLKCYKNKVYDQFTYEKYFDFQEKIIYSQILDNLNNNIVDPIEKFSSINNSYISDYKNINNIIEDEKDKESYDKNTLKEDISKKKEEENKYEFNDISKALDINKKSTLNINEIQNKENSNKLLKTGSFIINRLRKSLNSNLNNTFHKQNESNEMLVLDINNLKKLEISRINYSITNKKPITIVKNKFFKTNFSYSLSNNNNDAQNQNNILHNSERNKHKNKINEDIKNPV